MATAIEKLINLRPGKTTNILIGTPSIHSTNAWSGYTAAQLTQFVKNVYARLSTTARSKIAGVYMNQESIYGNMDYNNVLGGTLDANNQIKIMKQVRDFVKTGAVHGTKFMWCPYYGYGSNAATKVTSMVYGLALSGTRSAIVTMSMLLPRRFRLLKSDMKWNL